MYHQHAIHRHGTVPPPSNEFAAHFAPASFAEGVRAHPRFLGGRSAPPPQPVLWTHTAPPPPPAIKAKVASPARQRKRVRFDESRNRVYKIPRNNRGQRMPEWRQQKEPVPPSATAVAATAWMRFHSWNTLATNSS
ncbi:hypothetical protein QKT49_gp271 [Acanthamoeba castellanii medusavirus]|uniref:Uncharacterized protein n=1 Tax=Acanthamoeba castellanii medusavirus J1 TaxID=3114988 RepID=A0A3T1CXC3_9VIRU|nr:hypothetical protein QKT49_gp271 [Acanthamoeba castellanii medusavirus]BBI30492.1 hypothetical protein [Acanthamoeba castellanii medusavirus J1]